jgi:hypothetical protein
MVLCAASQLTALLAKVVIHCAGDTLRHAYALLLPGLISKLGDVINEPG